VIGGKWKTEIIHALRAGGLRFGVLLRRIPGASRKVLTEQLRELQAQKVVSRIAAGKRSERVEYSLTRYGRTLIPVLNVMAQWGEIHLKMSEVEPEPDIECASR
jgi:DNA-binding HxlR family transcriptional regulator